MTGKHPPPIGARTIADELRDDLAKSEVQVIQIGDGADGLALLRLLDRIADQLERLEQRGVDLRAEWGRLERVSNQLRRRASKLVSEVGPELAAQRPPDARWWWYLDQQVVADRWRRLKLGVLGVLAGVVLAAALYFVYDRFVAPPPHVRRANRLYDQGEQAVREADLARAVQHFEAAVASDPEFTDAYMWLGVLYQVRDDAGRAAAAFEQARPIFDRQELFLTRRGSLYLFLNEIDAANEDALAAIEMAPDRPDGYFLLGSVAEQVGDLELAAASFSQTAELAAQNGNIELEVTARMRLAAVLQTMGP